MKPAVQEVGWFQAAVDEGAAQRFDMRVPGYEWLVRNHSANHSTNKSDLIQHAFVNASRVMTTAGVGF